MLRSSLSTTHARPEYYPVSDHRGCFYGIRVDLLKIEVSNFGTKISQLEGNGKSLCGD